MRPQGAENKAGSRDSSVAPAHRKGRPSTVQVQLGYWIVHEFLFHGTVRYSRCEVFYFLNTTGKGSFSLLCSKDWLVSVPGPSFEGNSTSPNPPFPTAATESNWMGYFYFDSCILLHWVQKEVSGHLG